MPRILITDSLFLPIGGPDEERLKAEGYEIDRLDVPRADEETLIQHISGADGYILGGIESVTDKVIHAADTLKAIAFTGSGYAEFIPGWRLATSKGIAISAARGENADAVAEWSLVSALMLVRNIPALTAPGGPDFSITRDFNSLTLGIVGYGAIGQALARKAKALGIHVIATEGKPSDEVTSVSLNELVEQSDIISVHVSRHRGKTALDATAIKSIKPGSVLVNAAFEEAIDNDALLQRVADGELRAAVDYPLQADDLPLGALLASNAQTAFNTAETNARVGARATTSLLNLLNSGDDADLVNPEYRNNR
ncbi:NAD(P)-dependent oxidoreductase [Arthrobacter sp. B1I2]|uniref:NAD(P)-dependent oxidoreductase n=1 Tax=Arthrobacter sp. B1I2 TaxID=3042263 RepID=UPI002789A913|nr:NAD(P)-dependent oxidoreductase [Arthrobacter sp. B1I2]MDQ0733493.1 phosphoglycerate dehydrogenase-like enzyme [Arthrobacter sp. B1I2]